METTIIIRPADMRDIPRMGELLIQVCNVHAAGRPDIFIPEHRKYSDEELRFLVGQTETAPILIATDQDDYVLGYAFCQIHDHPATDNTHARRTLYLDDLCVDSQCRGQHIGTRLYNAVRELAVEKQCCAIQLNVWACNPTATRFYEKIGLHPLKTCLEEVIQE